MKKTGTTNSTPSLSSRIGCTSSFETDTFLTFTIEIHTNNLTHHQKYTKKQEIVYQLIRYLHEEKGMGYRKISDWLNRSGISTNRGKKWFNNSVHSVLKRKKQREDRITHQRLKDYPIKISKFRIETGTN